MSYSAVMTIAAAGLLPNPPSTVGSTIQFPETLGNALDTYTSTEPVSSADQAKSKAASAALTGTITNNSLISVLNLGSTTVAALADSIPTGYSSVDLLPNSTINPWDSATVYSIGSLVSYQTGFYQSRLDENQGKNPATEPTFWKIDNYIYTFSGALRTNVTSLIGTGDGSIFSQIYSAADGYIQSSNILLNSVSSTDILDFSFNTLTGGMNTVTTGSVNQITTDYAAFAADLGNLGFLLDLERIDRFGLPSELIKRIGDFTGTLPDPVNNALLLNGFTQQAIDNLASGVAVGVTAEQEHTLYQVLTTVTGDDLATIMTLLGVKPNSDTIHRLSDLLNLWRLTPNSYQTLLTPLPGTGLTNIYVNGTTVNMQLNSYFEKNEIVSYGGAPNTYDYLTLRKIIPSDQALACKAFSFAIKQVKGLDNTNLPLFSQGIANIQDNSGLPLVEALTSLVPSAVGTFLTTSVGNGTGTGNTLVLSDLIGTISLDLFPNNINTVVAQIQAIPDSAYTTYLQGLTNITKTLNGDYGPYTGPVVVPSGPGAGTYASWDLALADIVPDTNAAIAAIASSYPVETAAMNTAWTEMTTEIARETSNQSLAQIDIANLVTSSQSSVLSFVGQLHDIALDTEDGGGKDTMLAIANTQNLGGQCLVSSLREGTNIQTLDSSGVTFNPNLPTDLR